MSLIKTHKLNSICPKYLTPLYKQQIQVFQCASTRPGVAPCLHDAPFLYSGCWSTAWYFYFVVLFLPFSVSSLRSLCNVSSIRSTIQKQVSLFSLTQPPLHMFTTTMFLVLRTTKNSPTLTHRGCLSRLIPILLVLTLVLCLISAVSSPLLLSPPPLPSSGNRLYPSAHDSKGWPCTAKCFGQLVRNIP